MLFEAVAERAVEVPVQAVAAVEEPVADQMREVPEQFVADDEPAVQAALDEPVAAVEQPVADTPEVQVVADEEPVARAALVEAVAETEVEVPVQAAAAREENRSLTTCRQRPSSKRRPEFPCRRRHTKEALPDAAFDVLDRFLGSVEEESPANPVIAESVAESAPEAPAPAAVSPEAEPAPPAVLSELPTRMVPKLTWQPIDWLEEEPVALAMPPEAVAEIAPEVPAQALADVAAEPVAPAVLAEPPASNGSRSSVAANRLAGRGAGRPHCPGRSSRGKRA